MATVDTVYVDNDKLRVLMKSRAGGDLWIDVEVPDQFIDCIWKLVQNAVNLKEQQIRAEILGEEHEAS